MLDVFSPADGNSVVVELLEERLAEARKGRACHASVVMVTGKGDADARFAGLAGMEIAAYYGCGLLQRSLMDEAQKRTVAPNNPDASADRWYYDLFRMPISFDFAAVILNAEMTRRREGVPGPLKIAWYLGPDNDIMKALNTPQRQQYFKGIVRPMVKLLGAVEDQGALDGRTTISCSFTPVVQAYKQGEEIPKFTAPPEHLAAIDEFLLEAGGCAPVTITLRETTGHSVHRNSNLAEWIKFAEWLKARGENVIFIRDTATSRELLPDQCTCFAASEDLLIRAALYQRAKANLFVSNGPCILAIFGDRPWLMFNELQDDNWYPAGTTKGWELFTGVEAGGQFPWSHKDQRIIWSRDTFEAIRDAWLAHIAPSLSRTVSGYQLEPEPAE